MSAANETVKFVPTPEGMACAYSSLMIMALVPIFVGAFKSIKHQTQTRNHSEKTGEAPETMTDKDAAMFPLIASCALFGFYIAMKLFPELVNIAISCYFFVLGVFAISRLIQPVTHKIFPSRFNQTQYTLIFGSKDYGTSGNKQQSLKSSDAATSDSEERSGNTSPISSSSTSLDCDLDPNELMVHSKFSHSDILAFLLSSALGVWYVMTKHWIANNAFGLAFALNGIELLPINSARIGCILLCGLFFYDVFWVFGTDVMVSVAKKFDAPIKILFPQDFLVSGFNGKNFAMLGLGDIVIPGIFIAFLLRFDHSLKRKKNTYFWACFLAYVFGLGLTIGVMSYFKHAQPALLYLVPCCILIPYLVAIIQGDVRKLHAYRDHPSEVASDSDETTTAEEKNAVRTRSKSKKEA